LTSDTAETMFVMITGHLKLLGDERKEEEKRRTYA
jgi:hypothetical protein